MESACGSGKTARYLAAPRDAGGVGAVRLPCRICAGTFEYTADDRQYHAERGWSRPHTCPSCRTWRRRARETRGLPRGLRTTLEMEFTRLLHEGSPLADAVVAALDADDFLIARATHQLLQAWRGRDDRGPR
jgi:hypothetical protein